MQKRTPVVMPLGNWLPDRSLEEALQEHIARFSKFSMTALRAAMKRSRLLVILDGADEMNPKLVGGFSGQFEQLRAKYPGIHWVVSSRPSTPTTITIEPVVQMAAMTEEEVRRVLERRAKRAS
jgi:hypothetical protein